MSHRSSILTRSMRIARNALIDLRYGEILGVNLRATDQYRSFINLRNSDYESLGQIFRGRIEPEDVLVDIGCGKGRVINAWLHQGHRNRMIGLELDPAIAARTRRRLRRFANVEIITGDATAELPADGTLFYMYNPFGPHFVEILRDKIVGLARHRPGARLLYYNCKYVDVFRQDPACLVDVVRVGGPDADFDPLAVIDFAESGAP